MKKDESDLIAYFEEIKSAEARHIKIPAFTIPEKRATVKKYGYAISATIAASLLLFFGLKDNNVAVVEDNTMVITMTTEKKPTTNILIKEDASILNWESPTSILIQEFED